MARRGREVEPQRADEVLPGDPVELARSHPRSAIERGLTLEQVEHWPVDAVAAVLPWLPEDDVLLGWARSKGVSLWNVASKIPSQMQHPRDWANDLLQELGIIGSRMVEPWPADGTFLLGAPFHVHYRHATAEQLAWIDPAPLLREELDLLARHPQLDERTATNVLREIEARWHAGPEISDAYLARVQRRLANVRPAQPLGPIPGPLLEGVGALLDGDDDAVRKAMERTTVEVVFHRLLSIPGLSPRAQIELLLRVATLGFGWQRAVAVRRLMARADVTEEDFERAASGVRGDDFAEIIAEMRLGPRALRVLWERLPSYQHRVVKHPRAPVDLLEARQDFVLSVAVESSPDESWLQTMIPKLRESDSLLVMLENPRCPPEVLAEAQANVVAHVRWLVAGHPRASAETLRLLAKDPDEGVRIAVAENPAAGAELLEDLASDPVALVRAWVASHSGTPLAVLESLATDVQSRVRTAAISRLPAARMAAGALTAAEIETAPRKVRREAAARAHLDTAVLQLLVPDADAGVRRALAQNRALPPSCLETLARDADPSVRHAVAAAEHTPAELLLALSQGIPREAGEGAPPLERRWIVQAARR